jgi:quercetin dioxygenase-like cupin family protein
MRNLAVLTGSIATIIVLVLSGVILRGQAGRQGAPASLDMVEVCKKLKTMCKVTIDNERVRVTEVTLQPGETLGMHIHADGDIWMPRVPGTVEVTQQGSEPMKVGRKAYELVYHGPETHSIKNIGNTVYRSVVIELKKH